MRWAALAYAAAAVALGVVGCVKMTAAPMSDPKAAPGGAGAAAKVIDPSTINLSKPFSHPSHAAVGKPDEGRKLGCGDCHEVDGEPAEPGTREAEFPICSNTRMPFPSHDKCTGCHPKAMFTRPLLICTNCHTENSFSQAPPLKEQSGRAAPLKPLYSHYLHLNPDQRVRGQFKWDRDCTSCHAMTDGGEKVALPSHSNCCDCHTDSVVQPNINDCDGCHRRPKGEVSPLSKIEKYSHADHLLDPETGQSLDCVRCHAAVPEARTVKDVAKPVMQTCVGCHTGEVAFDYASCLKCHGPGIENQPVPIDHQEGAARRDKLRQ